MATNSSNYDPASEADAPVETAPQPEPPAPAEEAGDGGSAPPDGHKPHRGEDRRVLIIGAVVLIVLLAIGIVPRIRQEALLGKQASAVKRALPEVDVVKPHAAPTIRAITLPGTVEAVEQTAVNARATGYVKQVFVDIGDRVTEGQVLATISAPDQDEEVLQARAQVAQSQAAMAQAMASVASSQMTVRQQQANVDFARVTADRERYMYTNGAVSRQEYDQAESSYKVNVASLATTKSNVAAAQAAVDADRQTVKANQANLAHMEVLQAFERVTAPFSGIVTARNVDPGAYISAGGSASSTAIGGSVAGVSTGGTAASGSTAVGSAASGSSSAPGSLFSIAKMDRLRIYINLPQDEADSVRPGTPAVVALTTLPRKIFRGQVVHTTGAMDPTSRTLVAEVRMENPQDLVRPGMFANVKLNVASPSGILLVPDPALLQTPNGPEVVVADPDNKLRFAQVQVGEDDGKQIQILSGLTRNDRIVASATYDLRPGEAVRPVAAAKKTGKRPGRG